jgi:hypothetical protein
MIGKIHIPRWGKKAPPDDAPVSSAADQLLTKESGIWLEWPDVFSLRASVDYDVFGQKAGALYLGKVKDKPPTMVFGFDIKGTHVHDLARNIEGFYDQWLSGLQVAFMPYLSWKIHCGYRETSATKTKVLERLAANTDNSTLRLMAADRIEQVKELTQTHERCERFTHLYLYYWGRIDKANGQTSNALETGIKEVYDLVTWLKRYFSGQQQRAQLKRIEDIFSGAFYQGFQSTYDHLGNTFGLLVEPMDHDTLWANLRARFSGDLPGESPYKINVKIDRRGVHLSETISPDLHICNYLAKDGGIDLKGKGIVMDRWNPETEKQETDYIALLTSPQKFPGWKHGYDQIRSLHHLLEAKGVYGVEYFIDIGPSSKKLQASNAQEKRRQSLKKIKMAGERGDYLAAARRELREAEASLDDLDGREGTLRISFVVALHRDSKASLDAACRTFIKRFSYSDLHRETTCAGRLWLQTLPCAEEHLAQLKILVMSLGSPMPSIDINQRHVYKSKQAMGFLSPFARTLDNDPDGIELIASDGQPFDLDLFTHRKTPHWCATAEHRQGKSAVAQAISDRALILRQPVTWIDIPPKNGESSLKDRCNIQQGSLINILDASLNMLGIPRDLFFADSPIDEDLRQALFKMLLSGWLELLMVLGGPAEEKTQLVKSTRKVLKNAIDLFINDHNIQRRYHAALTDGFGSPAWHGDPVTGRGGMPTLADFKEFLRPHRLQPKIGAIVGTKKEVLDLLETSLSDLCDPTTDSGQAIARPSSVNIEMNLLTVLSLRGVPLGTDLSKALIAVANSIAIQKSIVHPISHLIFDEAHRVADDPEALHMMSDSVTLFGKAGVRVGIITNSFAALARTKAGQTLLDNLSVKFIGKIEGSSTEQLSKLLQVPIELVQRCKDENFRVNEKQGYSNWLVTDNGRHTFARMYLGWISTALSSSNSNERKAKARFFKVISDPVIALKAFTKFFRGCKVRGRVVYTPSDDVIRRFEQSCLDSFQEDSSSSWA